MQHPNTASRLALLVAAVVLSPLSAHAATSVQKIVGAVQLFRAGQDTPVPAKDGSELGPGDSVKTLVRSECEIRFDDNTKVSLGPKSSFQLKEEAGALDMALAVGTLRATVKGLSSRPMRVRTPHAVAAVRGTDFRATVDEAGRSLFDLYEGLIGVSDDLGQEKLLKPGERVLVDENGMGPVQQLSRVLQQQQEQRSASLKKEVGLGMSKESVLAAAAEEIKLAEYQAGKAIIDVFGNRVRLEQYILRPQPDEFKLVVLNERKDRFDYFFYLGRFNQALPEDLSLALRDLSGKAGAPPDWYLTGYETGRSNTQDTVQELASGGHLVDLNNNPDPSDDVAQYFDATLDRYVELSAGLPFYRTLFDDYSIAYNGLTVFSWTGTNIVSNLSVVKTYYGGAGNYVLETDFPDFPLMRQRIRESFGDGSVFVQYDNFLVSDEGSQARLEDFSGITSGPQYKETLLEWNFQQVITSSLFGGRTIDLVIEPKTLIQSGIIP